MGAGHGRHSKSPNHGAQPSHIDEELFHIVAAAKEARKAAARALQRLQQLTPDVTRKHPHVWDYRPILEEIMQKTTELRVCAEKGLHLSDRAATGAVVPRPQGVPAVNQRRCERCGAYLWERPDGLVCENGHAVSSETRTNEAPPETEHPPRDIEAIIKEHEQKRPENRSTRKPKAF